MAGSSDFTTYLETLKHPFQKRARIEFLQPDNSVAFALDNSERRSRYSAHDSRAFIQDGTLSVSLQNGARRQASILLANADGAFDYNVNKLWFGQRVRLLMGLVLPDGRDFYLPQGVFYIRNPSDVFAPGENTITLNLTDKWSYLDGSLFGVLDAAYTVPARTNLWNAMTSILRLDRATLDLTADETRMIDSIPPVYTTYYNGKSYSAEGTDGSVIEDIPMTSTPFEITQERGSTFGNLLLKLNETVTGWIGYDCTGALRVEPSQNDIGDGDKPVLFQFTPENSTLFSTSETVRNTDVYNDVLVVGEGLTGSAVWARAENRDPTSDTNIQILGRRVWVEENGDYWNTEQCADLARWYLKRKTVLQKSVSIECQQMFHLNENRLVSIRRTDKAGSPVEKHLIESFSIPIGETGSMTLNCVSAKDIPDYTITTSTGGDVDESDE